MIVKDTTAPVFNEINEVSFDEGTENYDFNQETKKPLQHSFELFSSGFFEFVVKQ